MEAIDTVMSKEQILFLRDAANINENKLLLGATTILAEKAIAQAQAGISFPKGEKQGIDKGRKEVVEWINERIDWKFALDAQLGGHISLNTQQWQAKLKEWGL